jgi:hypothetical protein
MNPIKETPNNNLLCKCDLKNKNTEKKEIKKIRAKIKVNPVRLTSVSKIEFVKEITGASISPYMPY